MSVKFRFHKGGYEESMNTAITVNSLEELKNAIIKWWGFGEMNISLVFKHARIDERNGWDTYMVIAEFSGIPEKMVMGWSNGILKK